MSQYNKTLYCDIFPATRLWGGERCEREGWGRVMNCPNIEPGQRMTEPWIEETQREKERASLPQFLFSFCTIVSFRLRLWRAKHGASRPILVHLEYRLVKQIRENYALSTWAESGSPHFTHRIFRPKVIGWNLQPIPCNFILKPNKFLYFNPKVVSRAAWKRNGVSFLLAQGKRRSNTKVSPIVRLPWRWYFCSGS